MLTSEQNDRLTRVGPGTEMGDLLRRYWHPIAGQSELVEPGTKAVRLFGEDLVLYRDLGGNLGLIERRCPHRGADLSHGILEECGLRCNYHGWQFDQTGACTAQPFEDVVRGGKTGRGAVDLRGYPVRVLAGMIWAYMGPEPAPELPVWEPFTWPNGFAQVVLSEVPCNWFQCQENSIDPVHFEWMHENWGARLQGRIAPHGPTHLKLDFDEFDQGFVYRRIKEDTDETNEMWTVGRVCLWPNGFFLGEHFEWRVPIDDERTLSVTWKYTRVPVESEPYVQDLIPTWDGPVFDDAGNWITSHVMNQDFLAWAGQGVIADRTREALGHSDRGIVMLRRRFFEQMDSLATGSDPKGIIRDPAAARCVELPIANRAAITNGLSREQIMANPFSRMMHTSYVFQAGQPDHVRQQLAQAMGLEPTEFAGLQKASQ